MITKTFIIDVDKSAQRSFRVKKEWQVTLIIVARSPKHKEAHITVSLVGNRAKATIIGFVVGKDNNDFSLHTLQKHEAPETTSDLLVKSVLKDQAKFSYEGAIRVERSAQKTDAYQRNENLLLSNKAGARSQPALEILANDVRCTHAATVGKVADDQLWYLSSRGLSKEKAELLITEGFLESALARISDTIVQNKVRRQLWQILSK